MGKLLTDFVAFWGGGGATTLRQDKFVVITNACDDSVMFPRGEVTEV